MAQRQTLFGSSARQANAAGYVPNKWEMLGATLQDVGDGVGGKTGGNVARLRNAYQLAQQQRDQQKQQQDAIDGLTRFISGAPDQPAAPVVAAQPAPAGPSAPVTTPVADPLGGLKASLAQAGDDSAPVAQTDTTWVPKPELDLPKPEAPHARRRITAEDAAPLLAKLAAAPGGAEMVNAFRGIIDSAQPKVQFDRGFGYDQNTGEAVGGFHPQLGDGQIPLFDSDGRFSGARNADGTVQSAAELAGAVEKAKAAAQAPYQAVQTTDREGHPLTISAEQLAHGGAVVGQSPAEKEVATGNAKTAVERTAAQPQASAGLADQARTSDLVIDTIDRVLGERFNPKTGKREKVGSGMVGATTTGFGANLAPIKGTAAHNLQAALDTIRANVGFDTLAKMRANSPTGGALGAVSERENQYLQSVLGSLDQGQDSEHFAQGLRTVRDQLAQVRAQRQRLYANTYSPSGQPASAAQPSRAEIEAELRRRKLLK